MCLLCNVGKVHGRRQAGRRKVNCERCAEGGKAKFVIVNAVIHTHVCARCSREARIRGLKIKRIDQVRKAA